ncbi:MAG: WxcM-like domain-containing protein [Candidatus Micrarchaeota archaeon]
MINGVEIKKIEKKSDERGVLIEFLRFTEIKEREGQVYCTTSKPGVVRGNHYHTQKTEWFTIIGGKALLALKDVNTGETQEIELNSEEPVVVKIPPKVIHAIKNTGTDTLYHLAYISKTFDPENPDTIFESIM